MSLGVANVKHFRHIWLPLDKDKYVLGQVGSNAPDEDTAAHHAKRPGGTGPTLRRPPSRVTWRQRDGLGS